MNVLNVMFFSKHIEVHFFSWNWFQQSIQAKAIFLRLFEIKLGLNLEYFE